MLKSQSSENERELRFYFFLFFFFRIEVLKKGKNQTEFIMQRICEEGTFNLLIHQRKIRSSSEENSVAL